MKYQATIAIIDGQPDLSGDILTTNVSIPNPDVIVYENFEKPIGKALLKVEEDKVLAEITIDESMISPELAELLTGVVGGTITKRNGVFVDGWTIKEVGLTTTPCDTRLPKLKRIEEE
jgi:hypothetical protein